jgi:hypothetical protein
MPGGSCDLRARPQLRWFKGRDSPIGLGLVTGLATSTWKGRSAAPSSRQGTVRSEGR